MKTYLFDFDGTLVDSMPTYVAVMKSILDENNISYDDDIVKTITPLGYIKTAEYFCKELGLSIPFDELVETMGKKAIYEYMHNVPLKKNVEEVLKKIKEEGVGLNVLTASPHIILDPCLKRLELYEIFDNVWSCDDFNTTKADEKIYHMVAERLGVDIGDVLFFDDNINADKTAKSAGMKVCGVYDETSSDCIEQMKEVCDHYIYDFSEIISLGM